MKLSDLLNLFLTGVGTYGVNGRTYICQGSQVLFFDSGSWKAYYDDEEAYEALRRKFFELVSSHYTLSKRVEFVCKKISSNVNKLPGVLCNWVKDNMRLLRKDGDNIYLVIVLKTGGVFYYCNKEDYTLYDVLEGITDIKEDFPIIDNDAVINKFYDVLSQGKHYVLREDLDFSGFAECEFSFAKEDGCVSCTFPKGECNVGIILKDGKVSKNYWLHALRFYSEVRVEDGLVEPFEKLRTYISKCGADSVDSVITELVRAMDLVGVNMDELTKLIK